MEEQKLKAKIKKYLDQSHRCLNCESEDIEGGSVEVDAGGATQDIACLDCGATWTDLYKLDYVINVDLLDDLKEIEVEIYGDKTNE